ncbi:Prefoldin subunit 6 [Sporothrix stenoceras]|uniref:Prefoldin subunit 6 n=1 Tax=Sporothrix stenoceras TaxID=5173 RepID=A0ABR3YVH1_9PEZI
MAAAANDAQAKLRGLTDEYTKLQQEQQTLIVAQQRLNAQKTENEGVKKEFENLKDGESIYKLVGPILLKQEKFEADSTVKGRLDFIDKEIGRLEDEIKESNTKMDDIKDKIMATQQAQPAQ